MGCNISSPIIPENAVTIHNNQYYDLLKNIRNGLKLTDHEIDYIKKIPHENLFNIIIIYDDMLQFYQQMF